MIHFHGKALWLNWWKSESEMKGHEMCYEVTLFHLVPHKWCTTWFEWVIRTVTSGDHSPEFTFEFSILNFQFIEVKFYNSYHEIEEDDE